MSKDSDHLDPTEATEAKLCAYLEGELDPGERAEIEQHLTANPQHRKLLAELAQTREWMRAIPQESAPIDLGEAFQVQVERNMLLDGDDTDAGSPIRWPQFAMIAAIVVLTLGLGVMLVIILKGPSGQHGYALSPDAGAATTVPSIAKTTHENTDPAVIATAPPSPLTVTPALSPDVTAAMKPAIAAVPVIPAAADIGINPSADDHQRTNVLASARDGELTVDEIKTKLAISGYRQSVDTKSVCFVVRSHAPAATMDQVHGFFTRHQLVLEESPSQNPANAADTRNTGDPALPRQFTPVTTQTLLDINAAKATDNAAQNPGGKDKLAQNFAREKEGVTERGVPARTDAAGSNNAVGGNSQQAVAPPAPGVNNNVYQNNAPQPGAGALPGPATSIVYVAHGLSPLQLELLSASLSVDNPSQTVQRLTLSEGAIKEPVPVPGAITRGQSLTITVAQLVGPGIDKTNVVKVGDDGNISLPMIDPVAAAGVTAADLQQRVATKYREANLIPDATVTIAMSPTTQPATMPATQPMELAKSIATTQSFGGQTAATSPAHDEGIDVVVVIEKAGSVDKVK